MSLQFGIKIWFCYIFMQIIEEKYCRDKCFYQRNIFAMFNNFEMALNL